MTKGRLNRILRKPALTDDDKEDLLDYAYFMQFQKIDAWQRGLLRPVLVSQGQTDIPGAILVPVDIWAIENIRQKCEGFQTRYDI